MWGPHQSPIYLALKMSDSSRDLVVGIIRVCLLIVGRNGSGESQMSDEPSCPGKRHQRIWTCLFGEVESPFSLIRLQAPDVKYPEKVERRPDRIPNVRYPKKVERRSDRILDMRYPKKVECRSDRIPDVRYPEKVEHRQDRIPDVRYLEKVERRLDIIPDVRYPEKVERWPDRILPLVE